MPKKHKTFIKFLEPYEEGLSKKGLIVTISGFSGAGKTTTARMIARKLRFKYFYPPTFRQQAAEEQEALSDVLADAEEKEFYDIDINTLRHALKGRMVVDSRLSAWVLGRWARIRIFLKCPPETRAKRVAERTGTNLKNALAEIMETDRFERAKWRRLYGIDYLDEKVYTHIIDNGCSLKELEKSIEKIIRPLKNKK